MACTGEERNVVILGKMGSGKRTLGSHIAGVTTSLLYQKGGDLDTENAGVHYGEHARGGTFYRIETVDTENLQTSLIQLIKDKLRTIHLIIFVTDQGRYTEERHSACHRKLERASEDDQCSRYYTLRGTGKFQQARAN